MAQQFRQTPRYNLASRQQQTDPADRGPNSGFKPVRLPALAAAVRQAEGPARTPTPASWPAILRKDAFVN